MFLTAERHDMVREVVCVHSSAVELTTTNCSLSLSVTDTVLLSSQHFCVRVINIHCKMLFYIWGNLPAAGNQTAYRAGLWLVFNCNILLSCTMSDIIKFFFSLKWCHDVFPARVRYRWFIIADYERATLSIYQCLIVTILLSCTCRPTGY